MSVFQQNSYEIKTKARQNETMSGHENGMSHSHRRPKTVLNIEQLVYRLIKRLGKLATALRFQLYRLIGSKKVGSLNIPWFKIGLAALVFFILSQKNVQLSFNIKAPFSAALSEEASSDERMGVAQSIAFRQKAGKVSIPAVVEKRAPSYIRRFSKVAQSEQDKYGIPASVKMAQAILESRAGALAEQSGGNNHFGAPMAGRNYESAWANWRAHSIYIAKNYPSLFQHGDRIEDWAAALSSSGYTDDTNYGQRLLRLIERFQLQELDR